MAGVMAHEIAHVAARHGTRQATRGQIAEVRQHSADLPGRLDRLCDPSGRGLAIPMGFLSFSRGFEIRGRSCWACEYMYKAGYDPTAFVDFFEKIQSLEKKKPGTMSKVFSTHPMTDDRIKNSQKNIQEYLKAKPEYVVTTSEFNDVKARLMAMHNHRKVDDKDAGRPRLRRAPGSSGTTIDDGRFRRYQDQAGFRRTSDFEAPRSGSAVGACSTTCCFSSGRPA